MEQQSSSALFQKSSSGIRTILLTGFIAGTLDIAAAITMYAIRSGGKPIRVFQYIASAVFGRKAFSGGLMMAFWGLIFHFIIAYAFTIFFFLVYPKINLLSKNIVVTGIIYGLLIDIFKEINCKIFV